MKIYFGLLIAALLVLAGWQFNDGDIIKAVVSLLMATVISCRHHY